MFQTSYSGHGVPDHRVQRLPGLGEPDDDRHLVLRRGRGGVTEDPTITAPANRPASRQSPRHRSLPGKRTGRASAGGFVAAILTCGLAKHKDQLRDVLVRLLQSTRAVVQSANGNARADACPRHPTCRGGGGTRRHARRQRRRRRERVIRRGRYESHLFAVDLRGRGTTAPAHDRHVPRHLATRVARTARSSRSSARIPATTTRRTRLCIVSMAGGRVRDARPTGSAPGFGAIAEIAWSPDGSRLAFTAARRPAAISIVGDRPAAGSKQARDRRS